MAAEGCVPHCWLSPGDSTLCHKAQWALIYYLHLKIAVLFNTAHLAGPRGTRSSGREEGFTMLKDNLQYSASTTWFGMPNPTLSASFSKAYKKSYVHTPGFSPLISWLFCPSLLGCFAIKEPAGQGAGPRSSSSCASAAFASSWCECQSQIQSTHPKQMLETCMSVSSCPLRPGLLSNAWGHGFLLFIFKAMILCSKAFCCLEKANLHLVQKCFNAHQRVTTLSLWGKSDLLTWKIVVFYLDRNLTAQIVPQEQRWQIKPCVFRVPSFYSANWHLFL